MILRSVSEVNPKTLNDALIHLKTGYESLRECNKRNLCVFLDYRIWLNKAFALFSVENMGNAITWKEWIAKEIGIQDSYAKQDAQLSQRDRAAGCVIVFAKSRRLELEDNIVIVDIIGLSSTAVI